jgi:hypothetical protein
MALSKKDILLMDDTEYKTIEVKAWKSQKLIIKSMSAKEKIDWIKEVENKDGELNAAIQLIVICCVDDDHKQLFGKEDIEALKNKSAEALNEISEQCLIISGIYAGAEEDAAKN